jgi:hypothetical protein
MFAPSQGHTFAQDFRYNCAKLILLDMVKFGAQAFTYGLAFAVCGVVALTAIKFTKPDEEKIRVLVCIISMHSDTLPL